MASGKEQEVGGATEPTLYDPPPRSYERPTTRQDISLSYPLLALEAAPGQNAVQPRPCRTVPSAARRGGARRSSGTKAHSAYGVGGAPPSPKENLLGLGLELGSGLGLGLGPGLELGLGLGLGLAVALGLGF